jgi:hypothetical protein
MKGSAGVGMLVWGRNGGMMVSVAAPVWATMATTANHTREGGMGEGIKMRSSCQRLLTLPAVPTRPCVSLITPPNPSTMDESACGWHACSLGLRGDGSMAESVHTLSLLDEHAWWRGVGWPSPLCGVPGG